MSAAWWRIAGKDARIELRSRATLAPALLTGLLVVVVGLVAFDGASERALIAAGTLWIGLSFATALGLARAFGAEHDKGTADILLTLPIERSQIYLGKVVVSFATLMLVALVLVPVDLLAGGEALPAQWPGLVLILALGALGLAATGTMMSALAAGARGRETLLPVLLVPITVPLLIAALDATESALHGAPVDEWANELLILGGYDVAFLAASTLLFEFVEAD